MADTHNLEKEIRDVLELTSTDALAGKPWYVQAGTYACELGDAIHAVTLRIEAGDVDAFRKPLIDAAYKVFDEVIAPLDMPAVPEWLEVQLEMATRVQIPLIVDELLERIRLRIAA